MDQLEEGEKEPIKPGLCYVEMRTTAAVIYHHDFLRGHLQQPFAPARRAKAAELASTKWQPRIRRGGDQVVDQDRTGRKFCG